MKCDTHMMMIHSANHIENLLLDEKKALDINYIKNL